MMEGAKSHCSVNLPHGDSDILKEAVIVTGASGLVGRQLSVRLLTSGYRVIPMLRTGTGLAGEQVDVTNRSDVFDWFRRQGPVRAVVHLAAIAHKPAGVSDDDYHRVNYGGTRNVLDAVRTTGARRFIFMSTASVYGELRREPKLTEDLDLRPIGPYAVAKARAEEYCLSDAHREVTILRPPAMYSSEFLRNIRVRAYLPGLSGIVGMRVVGKQPRYSLCAVENVVRVVTDIIDGRIPVNVYNVSDDLEYTQQMIARFVAQIDGTRYYLPVPAGTELLLGTIARLTWGDLGETLKASIAKLYRGQLLDIARITAAGYVPEHNLFGEPNSRPSTQ